ncbi:MAG: hypothetical protein EBZ77_08370 [Chitinophagia bacterium]|nr:hypothetical protein [Chitinophagia bacterium]
MYKLGYSLFHSFKHSWDGELGLRYLNADSTTTLSFLGSIAKETKEFYFNLRGYYINLNVTDKGKLTAEAPKANNYYSLILSSKCFVNPVHRGDYISFIAGYGTAPDDFSRNYVLARLLSNPTVSVGAGYTKLIHFRTTVGIYGTWYNQKVSDQPNVQQYYNQYDLYFQVLRRF